MTLQLIVFIVLALFIAVCSVLAVTTSRILRAATYLLFVLFGTAGIYFQLNYSFLGAVQLLIYAGGITVLYVFSILLTSSQGDKAERLKNGKMVAGAISTIAGLAICLFVMLKNEFLPSHFVHGELDVRTIGHALMGMEKYQYILPFFTRRNLLAMLISVELILNSVDINFAVFNRYLFPEELEGFFFALFAIGVSAAETAVAIAIIINIYRNVRNIQVKNLNEMKN